MKPLFDRALVHRFRSQKGIRPLNYIKTHFHVLAKFSDEHSLKNVTQALENNTDCDPSCLSACLKSSEICKLLFSALQTKMHYVLYVNEIEKQLDQLEYLDFKLEEVEAFTLLMQREASGFRMCGFAEFTKKKSKVFFCLSPCWPVLQCADDEHVFRRSGRVKTIALNTGDLKQFPWEKSCFQLKGLENVSQTIKIPKELLAPFANVRDNLMSIFGPKILTLAAYKRQFSINLKDMQSLDRTIVLDKEYLDIHAEPLMRKNLRGWCLDCLGGIGREVTLTQACQGTAH